MNSVFLLWHSYKRDGEDQDKLVGVYATHENAQQAILRLVAMPGFRDFPSGFGIDECGVDRDYWPEGFVTMTRSPQTSIDDAGKGPGSMPPNSRWVSSPGDSTTTRRGR
jgi:hypothetical protein